MFSLEKLKVYERALTSVAGLAQLSTNWDKRHAVVDQLLRASESVVLNLAEGARLRGGPQRQHTLESGDYTVQASLLFAHERLEAYQMKAESAQRGLVLLDRVALLVRGLVGTN